MIAVNRFVRPLVLLTAESAAVVALTALGARPPFAGPRHGLDPWLRASLPADVLVAGLRWVALAGAWWLLAGTLLYVAAALTRVPEAVRAVRWAALPAVRRAVDAALVVSLVTGSALAPGPGHAATPPDDPPPTSAVRDGHADGPSVPASTPGPADTSAVVAPGDNLWELSARRYAAATGRPRAEVGDGEVAPYWRAVCDQNRPTLASGDPNLIYPGERVVLPPVGGAPAS